MKSKPPREEGFEMRSLSYSNDILSVCNLLWMWVAANAGLEHLNSWPIGMNAWFVVIGGQLPTVLQKHYTSNCNLKALHTGSMAQRAPCYYCTYCILTPSRHMVLTRFPTLTGLVSAPPVLHPCFSLASSASCDAFTEQQTSFMEPGPCSTQARSSLGKNKRRKKTVGPQYKIIISFTMNAVFRE